MLNATPAFRESDNIRYLSNIPSMDSDNIPQRTLNAGLNILEYLAKCAAPVSASTLSIDLGIPLATLYRSMTVLRKRGYISKTTPSGLYEATSKIWDLLPSISPQDRVVIHARPILKQLCENLGLSCNLSIPLASDMMVIAKHEPLSPFWVNVPVGYRYPISSSSPGHVFMAFTSGIEGYAPSEIAPLALGADDRDNLTASVSRIAECGFAQVENSLMPSIIDLSCPIFDGSGFIAALTVPYMSTSNGRRLECCIAALRAHAMRLSESLGKTQKVA
ncbi:helix-turn-helix domain-containing protein [Asticcacaulis sp. SL142]|uniref:IclR family transcriptional regulator n=1 Tax=Asticcacaulis sp. SL142 TaxID=2995155 RepID=UPI00226CCAF1|nr:helix-turn-helix domain-containing protein [Asticcacaulis sp. SL142]WAC46855.1 helix-turn-helix domain-containing protein [Asticcacaulis sp. SL142]